MNYWPRWIGSIQKKTSHLSLTEMGAYDRLLDHCYATEAPLPADVDRCCRIAGASTKDERKAVAAVLGEFFTLGEAGYVNDRVTHEIAYAQPKVAAARTNGAKGGRPKGTQGKPNGLPGGFPAGTQAEPEAKAPQPQPQQIPSEAIASGASAPDPADTIFGLGVPLLTAAGVTERNARSMLGLMRKTHGDGAVIDALQRCASEKPLQPVAWLQASLKAKPAASKPDRVAESNIAVIRRFAERTQ